VITALHLLMYSPDAEADRAFLRDVLGWAAVADEHSAPDWLIFKAPPAEIGVHPTDGPPVTELHLMCDDLAATLAELNGKGVETGPISDEGWGVRSTIVLPSGTSIGLYQPRHPTAYQL